jgi:hypothetical protein
METSRICNFFQCSEKEIEKMYLSESMDTLVLLRWSKLLSYDFFRVYSQNLILYSPPSQKIKREKMKETTSLPQFRKAIYTREVIDFILEQIHTEDMTKKEVMERYGIPKTTLFKWIDKYSNR